MKASSCDHRYNLAFQRDVDMAHVNALRFEERGAYLELACRFCDNRVARDMLSTPPNKRGLVQKARD